MSNVKSGIGLKSYEWSSLELLKGLSIEQIKSNPSKLEERRPFFWHDMSSEFDSINLAVAGAECNTVIELKLEHHAA